MKTGDTAMCFYKKEKYKGIFVESNENIKSFQPVYKGYINFNKRYKNDKNNNWIIIGDEYTNIKAEHVKLVLIEKFIVYL